MTPDRIVPTSKQAEFLAAPEQEVLYGGSAGSGKSFCLLCDAIGAHQNAIDNPVYRALLIRRSFPELRDLIDKSRRLYGAIAPSATYNETRREWQFPSGAKIIFGYLEAESDKYQYQGQEFQYVAVDELTQLSSPSIYEYLISRLRAPRNSGLTCYMRATCNPGGPGHEWVRERWAIPDDGAPTRLEVQPGWVRRFIPARLDDNPHLAETGYRQQLMLLSDTERRALLEGRWDIYDVEGSVYQRELKALLDDGRYTRAPYDPALTVSTAWDLGMGDSTAIWFAQCVNREVRLIDYYEDSGLALSDYARILQRKSDEQGYLYGQHIAPHDIGVRELGSGKSRLDMALDVGIRFEVAPRLRLDDGIEAVRNLLPRCWFDQDKCRIGFNALRAYRWDRNNRTGVYKPAPLHDANSHAADALRYLAIGLRERPTARPAQRTRSTNWKAL